MPESKQINAATIIYVVARPKNENTHPKVKISMKQAFRHTPPKKAALKTRGKVVGKPSKHPTLTDEELFSHPIFHTRYAGKPYKYIRPFDPVWPSGSEN